jgi:hypothetical protein
LGALGRRRGLFFLFYQWRRSGSGLVGLVFVEPAFEEGDGGEEVVAFGDEQVDGVEVFLAAEAVPSRILIAFVAELRVYGFWGVDGQIAEFRRILEEPARGQSGAATELAEWRGGHWSRVLFWAVGFAGGVVSPGHACSA